MTLEAAFNIVLGQAKAHMTKHPDKYPTNVRIIRQAWDLVSAYALNEAANRKEWQDKEEG